MSVVLNPFRGWFWGCIRKLMLHSLALVRSVIVCAMVLSPGGVSGGRNLCVDSCKAEDEASKADEVAIASSAEEPLLHFGIHTRLIVRILAVVNLQLGL